MNPERGIPSFEPLEHGSSSKLNLDPDVLDTPNDRWIPVDDGVTREFGEYPATRNQIIEQVLSKRDLWWLVVNRFHFEEFSQEQKEELLKIYYEAMKDLVSHIDAIDSALSLRPSSDNQLLILGSIGAIIPKIKKNAEVVSLETRLDKTWAEIARHCERRKQSIREIQEGFPCSSYIQDLSKKRLEQGVETFKGDRDKLLGLSAFFIANKALYAGIVEDSDIGDVRKILEEHGIKVDVPNLISLVQDPRFDVQLLVCRFAVSLSKEDFKRFLSSVTENLFEILARGERDHRIADESGYTYGVPTLPYAGMQYVRDVFGLLGDGNPAS